MVEERAPAITVVVPSYRHAPYLEACLRSIAAQDVPGLQIVVVDDGSDDGSAQLLERIGPELGIEWRCAPHRGLMPTLEDLLSRARGRYYVSMGSDDIMPPGRLRLQLEHLEAHPETVGCSGQALALLPDGALRPMRQYLSGVPEVSFEDLFLGRKEIHTVGMMWRRKEFLEAGGYDMEQSVEDLPLWLGLTRRYGPIHVLPEVLTHYRIHGANLHLRHNDVYPSFLRAIDRHADHPLHARARAVWKANWFSSLCQTDRPAALRQLPALATFSWPFLRRLPKLVLPRRLFKR
jgi:glycosyltransferase involved in cell wall biosynthesis